MKVRVHFAAQLKRLAEVASIDINLDNVSTVQDLIVAVAEHGQPQLRTALLDDQSGVRNSILVFVNDELVNSDQPIVLTDRSGILITTLISGG
jgi:molybdopterin converting factor small subunit